MNVSIAPARMLTLSLVSALLTVACGGGEVDTVNGGAASPATAVAVAPEADAAPVHAEPGPSPAPAPAATPAPAPTPSPAPIAPAAADVSITAHGAVCDGSFDNSAAIASAIATAKNRGVAVFVPAGVCAYGAVIRLDGVKLYGTGNASILHALNWRRASIFIYGNGAEVRQLKLTGVRAPSRQADWEMTRISLFGAANFVIDRVTIEGSAAAGIQTAQATSNGRITNNSIKDTLSDSIHMTDRAGFITVESNRIENSGDDGIAVVSYRADGGLVHDITARNNVVLNNRWGRQMSVVGGSNVLYENNYLENNLSSRACLYFAQENSYDTFGAHDVVARNNTLKNCGGQSTNHGAVMIYSDGREANTNIALIRNDIQQSGQPGIRIFGSMNTGVRLDGNRVQGASPALDIQTPGVSVTPYSSGLVGYAVP
jgi:Pectate lyase superfamily protein